MKYKLIMLPNPILVSDEKINPTEPYLNNGVVFYADSVFDEGNNPNNSNPIVTDHNFKIIAGIEGLPILDLSDIAEEIGWIDVEKLAQKNSELEYPFEDYRGKTKGVDDDGTGQALRGANLVGFENGFKAAQSLNEKKFSEEDILNAYYNGWIDRNEGISFPIARNRYIDELSKPKEYNVEVEMEDIGNKDKVYNCSSKSEWIPKITNNTIKVTKILS